MRTSGLSIFQGAAAGILLSSLSAIAVAQAHDPTAAKPAGMSYAEWAVPLSPDDHVGFLNVCFNEASPPDPQFVEDMMEALWLAGRILPPPDPAADYDLGPRWSGTQGSPRALTWSFAPDGLTIPNGIGEGSGTNVLFSTLDSQFASQGGRATWVSRFQSCFDRWEALSGIDFTRIKGATVDWDDGAAWGADGSSTRGDIRIAMKTIDGAGDVLAYTSYPSEGDMVMDRQETWSSSSSLNRFLRNTVMHELGHAVGLAHVCSNNASFLMEPLLSTSFDGPRHDDIRAVQRHYGDPQENDNSFSTAIDIGTPTPGVPFTSFCNLPAPISGTNPTNTTNCSLDANGEQDWFRFTVTGPSTVNVTITPAGFTYDDNPQLTSGACATGSSTNSLSIANLAVSVYSTNGTTILATADSAGLGAAETLTGVSLPVAGNYYVRVFESNTPTETQLFSLSLTVNSVAPPPCQGDLDGDGAIGQSDLGILLGAFGCATPPCPGDINGDGATDQSDLGILLGKFGTLCP